MLKLITAPAVEPVSVADAKTWLRIDTSADDAVTLPAIITAARTLVEQYAGRALINQTWQTWLDSGMAQGAMRENWWDGTRDGALSELFIPGAGYFSLEKAPVASVDWMKSYDISNVEAVQDPASYFVDSVSQPARLVLNTGFSWPVALRNRNAIAIQFIAGYGTSGATVPGPILMAIQQLCAFFYEHRGDSAPVSGNRPEIGVIPPTAMALLQPYVIMRAR